MKRSVFFIYKLLFGNSLLHNVFYALVYIFLFDYFWEHFEAVYFAYTGVIYVSDLNHRIIGYIYALFPILFYRGLTNVSSWVSILLYYFGYVPIILGLCLDIPINSKIDIYPYYWILSISMSLFFLADRGKITFKPSKKRVKARLLWVIIGAFTTVLVVSYAGNMHLVSFEEIYQLRDKNSSTMSSATGYVYSWCANFFYPFVFCYGLIKNKKKYLIIGIALFLVLFSILGQKSDFFAPLILWGLYHLAIWQDKNKTNVMGPISLGILFFSIILLINIESESIYSIAGMFFSRTLGVSAYHTPMYLEFFNNNPYTYFSHLNFVNAITGSYPYPKSIGEMVANDGSNSNAIFWLMDGVASCGSLGVAIISIIVFLFLLLLNGLCNEKNKYFLYSMILIPIVALVNVSFFTTVLSKGILFLFLTIWFVDISFDREGGVSHNRIN